MHLEVFNTDYMDAMCLLLRSVIGTHAWLRFEVPANVVKQLFDEIA